MAEASEHSAEKLKVFISYSRDDLAFADQLVDALDAYGFAPIIDRHGISGGDEWKKRLSELITQSDTVVFALSPTSASSPVCQWEVDETDRLGKRLIPIVCVAVDDAPVPQRLKDLNYIFFYPEPTSPGSGFGAGLKRLVAALRLDLDWVRDQTRYAGLAASWAAGGRPENRLLSGNDIALAKDWLSRRTREMPEPTDLVLDFIRASEAAEEARTDQAKRRLAEREQLVKAAELAQARTRRVQMRSYAVLAVLFGGVLAGFWGVFEVWQELSINRSEFIASLAEDQLAVAPTQSEDQLRKEASDPVTAMLLAFEALPDAESAGLLQRMIPCETTALVILNRAWHEWTKTSWGERPPITCRSGSQHKTAQLDEAVLSIQALVNKVKSTVPRCLAPDERRRFHVAARARFGWFEPSIGETPRWCYTKKLWPYADTGEPYKPGSKAPYGPPSLFWDERVVAAWDWIVRRH